MERYWGQAAGDLRGRIEEWWAQFEARSRQFEFADRPLALQLKQRALQALQQPSLPEPIQAAILYLCDLEDEENDLSPLGMEDDAEVWNWACAQVGWEELRV